MSGKPWDKGFAIFWLVWMVGLISLIVLSDRISIWLHGGYLLSFFPPEMWAYARSHKRLADTLSEFWHKVGTWTGREHPWWKGWNMLVTGAATALVYETAYVFSYAGGSAWAWFLWPPTGLMAGLVVAGLLYYHWLRPDKYG